MEESMGEEYPRSTKGLSMHEMTQRLSLVSRALEYDALTDEENQELNDMGWIDGDDAKEIEFHPSIRAVQAALMKLGRSESLAAESRLREWQVVLEHAIAQVVPPPEAIHERAAPDNTAA